MQICSSTRHEQKLSVWRLLKALDVAVVSIPWSVGPPIEGDEFLPVTAG